LDFQPPNRNTENNPQPKMRRWKKVAVVIALGVLAGIAIEFFATVLIYHRYDWARDGEGVFLEFHFGPSVYGRASKFCSDPEFRYIEASDMYIHDALLGWRFRPNLCSDTPHGPVIVGKEGRAVSNFDKRRGGASERKPLRVLMTGGSTVLGAGALPNQSLPAHLERTASDYFRQQETPKFDSVKIANAGVGAYFSGQELLVSMNIIGQERPDILFSYGGWNELTRIEEGGYAGDIEHIRVNQLNGILNATTSELGTLFLPASRVRLRISNIMEYVGNIGRRSAVLHLFDTAIRKAVPSAAGISNGQPSRGPRVSRKPKIKASAEEVERAFSIYKRNLYLMERLAHHEGGRFVAALQPIRYIDEEPRDLNRMVFYELGPVEIHCELMRAAAA